MPEKVIIMRAENYDSAVIRKIVGRGMEELGYIPRKKVLLKPNAVIAHPKYFPYAFTNPAVLDGTLGAIRDAAAGRSGSDRDRGDALEELIVGEKSGLTIPTRYAFKMAGFFPILKKHGVRAVFFDEDRQVRFELKRPEALRPFTFVPEILTKVDQFVSVPKFKANPWAMVTFAVKSYIGLQDDRFRMIDHNNNLHTKIADLREIIKEDFIVVDGIVAGEKNMLTPEPYPLGCLIMGTDALAVDAVCCRAIGVDPREVNYLAECERRGLGSLDEKDIEISGDYPFEELKERGADFRIHTKKLDYLNEVSNVRVYLGAPPDPEVSDYCWGGCPGAFNEALEIVKQLQPGIFTEIKRMHIVIGSYDGKIDAGKGEPVLFVGDCTEFDGEIRGKHVVIEKTYRDTAEVDPNKAVGQDLPATMLKFLKTRMSAKDGVLRVSGCPVSIAELILLVWNLGGGKNPYFAPSVSVPFVPSYFSFLGHKLAGGRKR